MDNLTNKQADEICEILGRRANEIATFRRDLLEKTGLKDIYFPGSVELALEREVQRIRGLRDTLVNSFTEDNQ